MCIRDRAPTTATKATTTTKSTTTTVAKTTVPPTNTATVNGQKANIGDKVAITYYVKSDVKWEDFQGTITYDSTGVKLDKFTMPNTSTGVMYNTEEKGIIYYSGSSFLYPYDFTTEKVFFIADFTVISAGDFNVVNNWQIIDGVNQDLIVGDGIYDSNRLSCRMITAVNPEETTVTETKNNTVATTTTTKATTTTTTTTDTVPPTTKPAKVLVSRITLNT